MGIRVIKGHREISEEELSSFERDEGWTLISVNHVLTHEYPAWSGMCESKQEVVRWVYHFRTPEEKT